MGQITKATKSIYKAGDVVTVTDTGQVYSTYRDMARHLGLLKYVHTSFALTTGQEVTVIASAMHESEHFGEVVGVRTESGEEMMIGVRGISEPIEQKDENGHTVLEYDRALLTDGNSFLRKAVDDAPEWALYIGQDDCGIHYFDHHPYMYSSTSLLKGLLPSTHRCQFSDRRYTSDIPSAMRVSKGWETPAEIINRLHRELAEVKAKLWLAENKLTLVKEVVE